MPIHQKKRVYEAARPAANTKLGEKKIRKIKVRGGNFKFRALRLHEGNFNWSSEGTAFKTRITEVVYHPSDNEFVRTRTIVKNSIVSIDAAPFKNYIAKHYFGATDKDFKLKFDWESKEDAKKADPKAKDFKYIKRRSETKIDQKIRDQINKGVLLACISSRPGQSGRADGYILEGKELEFYVKKSEKK